MVKNNFILLCISLVLGVILFSSAISALTADVQVNEDPWYTPRKATNYGGTELTNFYVPLPVFFEGWASSPKDDIINYRWDFGDGSVLEGSGMFNSAHIYETPGTYTATLTVKDSSGTTASDTIQITARARDGITYYVDSAIGDDNLYDGKCQAISGGCGPWQTATKAFRMIGCGNNNTFYQPGDQILFKRGQTFYYQSSCGQSAVAQPGHNKAGYGYLFGTYGTGAKPIIKPANGVDTYLIAQTGLGMAFVTFRDLNFIGRADNGVVNTKEIFQSTQKIINILFYNNDFKDQGTAIVLSGQTPCTDNINGAFIFNNTMFNSTRGVLFFAAAGRLAFIGNSLDLSENHDAYLDPIDNGIILDNTFSRPAHGRTALRIAAAGASVGCPSNNVYVAKNEILGWIDPVNCTQSPFTPQVCTTDAECVDSDPYTLDEQCLNATSNFRCKYYTCKCPPSSSSCIAGSPAAHDGGGNTYNWLLTQFGPQESGYQSVQNIIFEDNTVTNADTLLGIWAAENITVRNNLFISQTGTSKAGISVGSLYPGGAYNGQRPNKNIQIIGNTITLKNAGHHISAQDSDQPVFTALNYPSSGGHENIVFKNNLVYIGNKTRFGSSIIDNKIGSVFSSDYNVFYIVNANENNLSFNGAPGINFSQWKATTGNDFNSLIIDPQLINVPNINLNPWFSGLLPIVDLRLLGTSPAIGAGANLGALLYYDFERKIRGAVSDIGAYEFTSAAGGSTPSITTFYTYPSSSSAGANVYVYCNASDPSVPIENLNVNIEYKLASSSTWIPLTTSFLARPTITTHGDSITAGWDYHDPDPTIFGVNDDATHQYEYWLDKNLNSNTSAVNGANYEIYNNGYGGQACNGNINTNFVADSTGSNYSIIMCGTNYIDQWPTRSQPAIQTMVSSALSRGITPILMTIPPMNYSQKRSCQNISDFNNWLISYAQTNNIKLIDLHPLFTNGGEPCIDYTMSGLNESMFDSTAGPDANGRRVHPNVAGHKIIAQAIWEQAFNKALFRSYKAAITLPTQDTYNFRCTVNNGINSVNQQITLSPPGGGGVTIGCGNGLCELGETASSCDADCTPEGLASSGSSGGGSGDTNLPQVQYIGRNLAISGLIEKNDLAGTVCDLCDVTATLGSYQNITKTNVNGVFTAAFNNANFLSGPNSVTINIKKASIGLDKTYTKEVNVELI